MNVLGDSTMQGTGKIEVHHMQNVDDIQSTSSDTGGNHNGTFGTAERTTLEASVKGFNIHGSATQDQVLTWHPHAQAESVRCGWR